MVKSERPKVAEQLLGKNPNAQAADLLAAMKQAGLKCSRKSAYNVLYNARKKLAKR